MITETNMTSTSHYSLRYNEMDYKLVLKPSALLNFLQDLASENAEEKGFGYSFVSSKNYAWFLLKYHMEFDEYPENEQELVIKTEPRGYNKIMAFRDFEILNKSGKLLGRVCSTWAMINLTDKSMINLEDEIPQMSKIEKRDDDMKYEKIKPLSKVDFEHIFDIRYDDIDVNRHVNNANYIIWAFEALPYEFKCNHKLKKLDMIYKKEIKFGNQILSQVDFDEENLTSIHTVKNKGTDEDLCIIKAEFV